MDIKKTIFLASSFELKDDRDDFQIFISQINEDWGNRGIQFEVRLWENFIESIASRGLQERYNEAAKSCDIFLMLFFTKVGEFTNQEFEAALDQFKKDGKPLIYTYFKEAYISTGSIDNEIISMLDFKNKLRDLNHYVSVYTSVEDLKWKFNKQLEKIYGNKYSINYINSLTNQADIDSAAIERTCRLFSPQSDELFIKNLNLRELIFKASDFGKSAIFQLAKLNRRSNRKFYRNLMARSIPVLETLIEANIERARHDYYGQLAYALKDQEKPNWEKAEENFNYAIRIRTSSDPEPFYEFNRAICTLRINSRNNNYDLLDSKLQELILEDLRYAKKGIGQKIETFIEDDDNIILFNWLRKNDISLRDL
ncbi:hypothetical protein [Aquiflexum sp.]|uniref:hypothetical protein n=1 Tax=Aquiflexum sp. TaxID=1872584 RepID=UPI003593575C